MRRHSVEIWSRFKQQRAHMAFEAQLGHFSDAPTYTRPQASITAGRPTLVTASRPLREHHLRIGKIFENPQSRRKHKNHKCNTSEEGCESEIFEISSNRKSEMKIHSRKPGKSSGRTEKAYSKSVKKPRKCQPCLCCLAEP